MAMHALSLVTLAAFVAAGAQAEAQAETQAETEHHTRQLWDDAFKKQRPEAATARPRPSSAPSPATPAPRPEAGEDVSFLGVTLWRLRPLGNSQGAVVATAGDVPLTAERVEVGTRFAPEDRVRLGIESARSGYLYLIDRERYADGSLGDPYLIFPRSRIRAGDNRVVAGRLVEIPDLGDTPPYFTLKSSRGDHTGEVITVLLTPAPLPDLPAGRAALKLERAQVEEWERKWAAPLRKIELPGGAGQLYTASELEAASGTTARLLTQEEPAPQTLYRIEAKPGDPLLLSIPLGTRQER